MNRLLKAVFLAAALAASSNAASAAGQAVTYTIDGLAYEGYAAKARWTSKGLVVIIHDWDGLTAYEIQRAEMLSVMGYDAFAIDLYGKGNRPVETGAKEAETGKLYNDRETMRARILAGIAEARKMSTMSKVVIGYCFGGAAALELARSGQGEGIKGFATFHGGLKTPDGQEYPRTTPPILIAHGGADKAIPLSDVATLAGELEAAGVTYKAEIYSGAPHAFTVIGSSRYQERADKASWSAFASFLDEQLGN